MKKFLALILCLSVMTVATACGSKDDPTEAPADPQIENNETLDNAANEADPAEDGEQSDAAEDEDQEEATYTGVLEEKKDFMVIVGEEDKSASYMFTLGDGVTCDAEVGETITVTYTGDMSVPVADQSLTATAVTVAE